jgi:IS4 transposase
MFCPVNQLNEQKVSHFFHVFDYQGKKSWCSSEIGKALLFLSNNLSVTAATICVRYKARWRVELFFKWIK